MATVNRLGGLKVFTLSPARTILPLNLPNKEALSSVRNKVLSGQCAEFAKRMEVEFSAFAQELGLEGELSWKDATLTLNDGKTQAKVCLLSGDSSTEFGMSEYVIFCSFLCWLTTDLAAMKGYRASIFVHDFHESFSFSWNLSREQSETLEKLYCRETNAEANIVNKVLAKLSEVASHTMFFQELCVVDDSGKALATFNRKEATISLMDQPRKLGITILAFYCWLVDTIK